MFCYYSYFLLINLLINYLWLPCYSCYTASLPNIQPPRPTSTSVLHSSHLAQLLYLQTQIRSASRLPYLFSLIVLFCLFVAKLRQMEYNFCIYIAFSGVAEQYCGLNCLNNRALLEGTNSKLVGRCCSHPRSSCT